MKKTMMIAVAITTTLAAPAGADSVAWESWHPAAGAPSGVRSVALAQGPIAGNLEVFAVSSGGTLYHNFLNSGGWHTWTPGFDGAPTNVVSVALAQGPIAGNLEVFAVTSGGTLYHNFLSSGGWHGWTPNFDGAPGNVTSVALAQGPINGALEVFLTTGTGGLYHNFLNSGGWHGWEANFNGAPPNITSVALAQGPIAGALEVFATTSNGVLFHNFLNSGGWHGWAPNFDGAPVGVTSVALAQGPIAGALEVFATTSSGVLFHNFLNSGGWHGWAPNFDGAPGNLISIAMARRPLDGALEVLASTASGVLHRNYLSNSGWHGWEGSFSGAPGGVTSVAMARGPIDAAPEAYLTTSSGVLYQSFIKVIPSTPTNVRVTGTTSTSVSLAWTDNATYEQGYRVANVTNGAVRTLAANTTSTTFSSLSTGTTYCFDVRAVGRRASSPDVRVCATPQVQPKTTLMALGRVVPITGAIYHQGSTLIRGTLTRMRVPSQYPVTTLLIVKPGYGGSVCNNPQSHQVVVAPVGTDVNLTALFGSNPVSVNGFSLTACALVAAGHGGTIISNVLLENTYLPAP